MNKIIINKLHISLIFSVLLLISCDLEEVPKSEISNEHIFKSERGLELYSNSFYEILPSASDIFLGDDMSDYVVRNSIPDFLTPTYSATLSTGWSWNNLRNINYFIENCNREEVDSSTRLNYIGIARFFRALFYFEKVKRFGDVPWVNKTLDVSDNDILYGKRDPRTLVMDSVLADINFACDNITKVSNESSSQITKMAAYALKSRICLFEGTFRKYHPEHNLSSTVDFWLKEARDAASSVIESSEFKIHTASGVDNSYRDLFISPDPVHSEVILAIVMDKDLGITHNANWKYTSSTYGVKANLNKIFINTYLNIDGTPFTNKSGYNKIKFSDEVKNRDKRLKQTIRLGDYTRINGGETVLAAPDFSYSLTGYQPIKWNLDDTQYDNGALNYNSVPVIRYAEVLLNFAEAKAELGEITPSDWAVTIGELRKRAGITANTNILPTVVDSYLQKNYYPNISDPVILEIRRERAIELALEGFRFYDLVRWRRGELLTQPWRGMYVPDLNVPLDLNEDGLNDVVFVEKRPTSSAGNYIHVVVGETLNNSINPQQLTEGNHGLLTWLDNQPRLWNDKNYFYPIPENALLDNPNLGQNPGW